MNCKEILKQYFGYDDFRYPQEEIIESVLAGKDTIAILPTGFGKSITFQIPAIYFDGLTLVVCPLIALMEDQKRNLLKKGIPASVLHSNLSFEEQEVIMNDLKHHKLKLLYVSPERLQNEYFKEVIKSIGLELLVIDEAHTILWAEGFRKAFGHINEFIDVLSNRPRIIALTATATKQTIGKIKNYLNMYDPQVIGIGMDRPNLFYRVEQPKYKVDYIKKYLQKHLHDKGIIYCLTRKMVEHLASQLKAFGFKSVIYHGGLDTDIKKLQQDLFTRGIEKLMICTNAFGMGIDIPDIRFVINYELPASLEDLAQQIGRAARDGKQAEGVVLFSFSDIRTNEYFINKITIENQEKVQKEKRKKLNQVVDYCLSKRCRHQILADYFGQQIKPCNCFCDNCSKKRVK